jgi:hypothetical protein
MKDIFLDKSRQVYKETIMDNWLYIKEYLVHLDSKRNLIINEVNWNILVTLGKEIKRDSMISENESREAYILLESTYCYK